MYLFKIQEEKNNVIFSPSYLNPNTNKEPLFMQFQIYLFSSGRERTLTEKLSICNFDGLCNYLKVVKANLFLESRCSNKLCIYTTYIYLILSLATQGIIPFIKIQGPKLLTIFYQQLSNPCTPDPIPPPLEFYSYIST